MEGRPRRERELVLRAQRGDPDAYRELVRPHQEIAFRVAYVITRNPSDAEEATQDALVKAWRALGRFRAEEALRPWLLRIVANEARDRRRATGRQQRLALRAAESSGEAAPSPEETVLDDLRRAELLRALDELPDTAREILAYRFLLELGEGETAAALDVPVGTVKSRTSRALERLKEAYGSRA